MELHRKIVIYQILTRLFGNTNLTCKEWGSVLENGCGKLNQITTRKLNHIHDMGFTHVWYTGIIRHATQTNYSSYGIPTQNARVVKGKAGSPYAITDYYDVDPDLAENVDRRMEEFEELVKRTHQAGLKVLIDFVPNHVARQYKSICKPQGVKDLGEDDDTSMHFNPQNNFYYCPGETLDLQGVSQPVPDGTPDYIECPAKCTGNDRFDSHPQQNDWYETVKLNYGIDYTDAGGRSTHFIPTPNTWLKMTDILLFWASKGIDGFRCDMAEMVPAEFWAYATARVKKAFPGIIFVGEVYDPGKYRCYIQSGFDYLYDKVGMYDCLRGIICQQRPASAITREWQGTDDIKDHMLYFLENHDEQRIASDFFCGDAFKAIPALIVEALFQQNPIMIYAGQEVGERGMYKEGFSGRDGRTTIFDYWGLESLEHEYADRLALTPSQRALEAIYRKILNICNDESAVSEGQTFDLMYVNGLSAQFNPHDQFVFMRKFENTVLLVIANFSAWPKNLDVTVPSHAFDFLGLPEKNFVATDLLTNEKTELALKRDSQVRVDVKGYSGRIYKFQLTMDKNSYVLNAHNKDEFPPAHTAEHLLNQLMIRMFGTQRSSNAHIERKKSKMTFTLDHKPSRTEEKAIETEMNRLIAEDLPVTYEYVDRHHLPDGVSADRLPANVSDTIRLVRIGDYDVCPCAGKHVRSTSQIGRFVLLGTNWDEHTHSFRVRFKVIQ